MPYNPKLFPPDFDSNLQSEELTLEAAVLGLQVQALNTARRQAHTRRIGGQNSIANQNQRMKLVRPILMPLHQVGNVPKATPFSGTVSYLGGGRGHGGTTQAIFELLFSNDAVFQIGSKLSVARPYIGTVGNASAGLFCGGNFLPVGTIDQFTYSKKILQRVGAQLSQSRAGPAGGIGNQSKGILAGGRAFGSTPAVRTGDRVNYGVVPSVIGLGNLLSTNRFAAHNGTCNRTSGYVYGGVGEPWWNLPLFTIERINYTLATETVSPVGATLNHMHMAHGAAGNLNKGYLAGGGNNVAGTTVVYTDTIAAFTYSGETYAPLAATLPEAKICADGTGSGMAAYFVGGDTATSNWQGTKTIDKLFYNNESLIRINAQLSTPQADQGAISDYGAGFSV